MAVAFEYLIGLLLIYSAVVLLNFSIGEYLQLISLSEDIKYEMRLFNENAKQYDSSTAVTDFGELIQFHSEVIQLSDSGKVEETATNISWFLISYSLANDLSEMGEFIYTVIFSWSLTAMCGSMLLMQIEIVRTQIKF